MLEDIAVLTGGQAVFEDLGIQLETVGLNQLGRAKKVKIDKDNTTIIEGAGKKQAIQGRIQAIQRELEKSTSDYDKEKLSERIAKLSGGVAKINVGAATESEMKEKKARVEDAMHATRAAAQEGVLPGGGVALLRASAGLKAAKDLAHDEEIGYNIVVRACRAPIQQIAENAGEDGAVVMNKVLDSKDANFGYDAAPGSLWRHGQGRHYRSDQGGAFGAAERGQRGDAAVDQRRPGGRDAQGRKEAGRRRRWLRRYVLSRRQLDGVRTPPRDEAMPCSRGGVRFRNACEIAESLVGSHHLLVWRETKTMFTANDIDHRVKVRPFRPFRIVTSSDETYDVAHPELILVGQHDIVVGLTGPNSPKYYDQIARIALMHVTALHDLPVSAPPPGNGQT